MAMGMSFTEFWDGTPFLAVVYRKAFKLRLEMSNEQAWLQGLYIYDAVAVCLSNAFSKRGSKKLTYIEKPVDLFPLTEAEKRRREQEEYAKMQTAMEEMIRKQQRTKKSKGE